MNFGQYQYQHRFFGNNHHKKPALYTPSHNNVLPLLSQHQFQSVENRQAYTHSPIYSRTKADHLRLLYTPQKESPKQLNPFTEQYNSNAMMLERYRREAEQYKHNMRFKHLRRTGGSHLYKYQSLSRPFKTQGSQVIQPSRVIYNPEILVPMVPKYDAELMARIDNYQRQRDLAISRLERDSNQSKMKMKEYQKKYGKLKNKLKEELRERKKIQMMALAAKEKEAKLKEKNRLSQIRGMMQEITEGLKKNSQLLCQSIKVHKQLSMNNSSMVSKKASFVNAQDKSRVIFPPLESSTEYYEESPPKSPPSVLYTKKSLDGQFEQMERIQRQIQDTGTRLHRNRL